MTHAFGVDFQSIINVQQIRPFYVLLELTNVLTSDKRPWQHPSKNVSKKTERQAIFQTCLFHLVVSSCAVLLMRFTYTRETISD